MLFRSDGTDKVSIDVSGRARGGSVHLQAGGTIKGAGSILLGGDLHHQTPGFGVDEASGGTLVLNAVGDINLTGYIDLSGGQVGSQSGLIQSGGSATIAGASISVIGTPDLTSDSGPRAVLSVLGCGDVPPGPVAPAARAAGDHRPARPAALSSTPGSPVMPTRQVKTNALSVPPK